MSQDTAKNGLKRILLGGGIIAYVIMAFEVAIMISPFAFFFYSVFNPIFHFLGGSPATRWLTAFFLPHMILPPSAFLRAIRVIGSVLFVLGLVTFAVCALQVYAGKLFKWRVATRGLYRVVRHPQYVALIAWGIGMAILWPRFMVLVTLSLMIILYYFLAKDEERRMINAYGDEYRGYMRQTGMFVPLFIERRMNLRGCGPAAVPILALTLTLLIGFGLRGLTVSELPVIASHNIGAMSILPEDSHLLSGIASRLVGMEQNDKLITRDGTYLAYVMRPDYVMQGMIANTGEHWQLYKRHHTFQMIADWVIHPFGHLQNCSVHAPQHTVMNMPAGGCPLHAAQMARRDNCPLKINDPDLQCDTCPYRRVIVVKVDTGRPGDTSRRQLLSASAKRTPVSYLDIDTRSGKVIHAEAVNSKTAWAEVPTPIF